MCYEKIVKSETKQTRTANKWNKNPNKSNFKNKIITANSMRKNDKIGRKHGSIANSKKRVVDEKKTRENILIITPWLKQSHNK